MPVKLADDALTDFIAGLNAQPPSRAADVGPQGLRAAAKERTATRPPGPAMHSVADVAVPPAGVPARLYRPVEEATPLVVYLHGGGWVFGNVETHDRACRRLAAASGASVLSLDYRLAPEHPWPAAVDDAVAALRWVAARPAELDPQPPAVAIAGDSAGGTTGLLACLRLRHEAPEAMPDLQVLLYANTDLTNSGASMQSKARGFGLDVADIEWFGSQWVPDPAMRRDPRVSPLYEPDLSGLPATLIVTCEHDPLRDQGEAFARRLADAGVSATLRREPGMVHNFLLWDLVSPACAAAGDRVAADVRRALAPSR